MSADLASLSWFPASVGAARRTREESARDLESGAAWATLLEALDRAGQRVGAEHLDGDAEGRASGFRHLLVLLALGVDEVLRSADPRAPVIAPGNVDNALKWGMDCPDALYTGSAVRAGGTYRVTGRRGSARYLGFQVMAQMAAVANLVGDELVTDRDGEFEIVLSAEPAGANWLALTEGASSLVVRQFFYDWNAEEPAVLRIECLEPPPELSTADVDEATALARQLPALGAFIEDSITFWDEIEQQGRAQGLNVFREPAARTDMGGAAENVTVWGSYELAPDQALVIEVTPPEALYWSVSLGNRWWESIDYAAHQSSLNGHQAVLDADGRFRAVVAHSDPGVANWLDTAGSRSGPMIFRYVRADGAPVPATRVVSLDHLGDVLPAQTTACSLAERTLVVAGRTQGVRRRFPR